MWGENWLHIDIVGQYVGILCTIRVKDHLNFEFCSNKTYAHNKNLVKATGEVNGKEGVLKLKSHLKI